MFFEIYDIVKIDVIVQLSYKKWEKGGAMSSHKAKLALEKEARKQEVVRVAAKIFKESGIDNTKISDIAKEAGVGVASMYRYYKTKSDIVIATGIYLWQSEIEEFLNDLKLIDYDALSGYEQVVNILSVFQRMVLEKKDLLCYLEQFDNYIVKEKIPKTRLDEYEAHVLNIRPFIEKAIEHGQEDGTIDQSIDATTFYVTVMHMLMSLSQKLVLRGDIISHDTEVTYDIQIKMAIDMVLNYISAK